MVTLECIAQRGKEHPDGNSVCILVSAPGPTLPPDEGVARVHSSENIYALS
jgi:hypothetical protein